MNKRQHKKYTKNDYPIWNCFEQEWCEEDCAECSYSAQKWLRKALKKEGYSMKGWSLFEVPVTGVFIFLNRRKNKEITLEYENKDKYAITVFDIDTCRNIPMGSIKQALTSPLQQKFKT